MQNAPREPVYYDPELGPVYDDGISDLYLDRHPELVHDYLYGEGYFPLSHDPLFFDNPPPPGQIVLARPWPVPDDASWAQVHERNTNWLRIQSQNLLLAGDLRTLREQEDQFSTFVSKLLFHRGFEEFWLDRTGEFDRRFSNREVVETTERLYERHNDVRLRMDLATGEFDLCGPNTRVRDRSDDVVVSLRPVIDALWMTGLWTERADERFGDLARAMVRLAHCERRRVGPAEFVGRYGRGGQ